jgi:hypothetical protein
VILLTAEPIRSQGSGKTRHSTLARAHHSNHQASMPIQSMTNGDQDLGSGRLDSLDIQLSPEWIPFNLARAWDQSSILLSAEPKVERDGQVPE